MARNDGMVYLSNEFIREGKFAFTMQEWRIFLRLISLVNKYDTPQTVYSMRIDELARAIGLDANCRMTLTKIRTKIQDIRDKSFYIGSFHNWKLIDTIQAVKFRKGEVSFKFCDNLCDYAFNLMSGFVAFDASIANAIDSLFALKLYMLMKSYASIGSFKESPNRLIEMLYDRDNDKKKTIKNKEKSISDLKRKLKDAVRTINDMTDIHIEIEGAKDYERCKVIEFRIDSTNSEGLCYYDFAKVTRSSKQKENQFKKKQLEKKLIEAVEQSKVNHGQKEISQDIAAAAADAKDKHIIEILYNHDIFKGLSETARKIVAVNDINRLRRVLDIVSDWT